MEVTAKLNNLRKAPRKLRLVANLIKGMTVVQAENELKFSVKDSSRPILKLLQSAVANAENNFHLDKDNLYISKITVDNGQNLKRWRPRAFGRAAEILRRASHINLILSEIIEGKNKKAVKSTGTKNVSEIRSAETKDSVEAKPDKKKFDLKKEDTKMKQTSQTKKTKVFRRKSI